MADSCLQGYAGLHGTVSYVYVPLRLDFLHLDQFELDLRGQTQPRGAAVSIPRFKLADMVLI